MIWNGFLFTIGVLLALVAIVVVYGVFDIIFESIREMAEKQQWRKMKEAHDQKYGHIKHMEL